MKLASTIFLLAALLTMLYVNIGQVGGVCINIGQAKQEASENINSRELSVLIVTEADLSSGRAAFTDKNEILFNGDLYDIASRINQGDKLILKVLHDKNEEGLLSDLKEMIDAWANNPQKSGKQSSLKQIVIIKDFMPACKFTFNCHSALNELFSLNYYCPSTAPLIAVLKSPPKFV